MASRKVPPENNVELKCVQINIFKYLTKITQRGGGI